MTWNLELTDNQLQVLLKALELYGRVKMGQFSYILDWKNFPDQQLSYDDGLAIESLLKKMVFPELEPNAFWSIRSEQTGDAKEAYDIQQVVRQKLSWDKVGKDPEVDQRDWSTMMGVNFDDPLPCGSEPLPKMEKKNGK